MSLRTALLVAFALASLFSSSAHAANGVEVLDPSSAWQNTLKRAIPAVVSIRVTQTRDFDTEDASNSQGTGFVVDAENGIILTNRHMVHAGPVIAEAVFLKNEEVRLIPVYRDPVHDFGFYRFDPDEVQFTERAELELSPQHARKGTEIRVVGNDAGEKISILDGTLAVLDRAAPHYGRNSYNDFNTFYIQAASNTSGGSSGSPVIDIRGRVVGLNAGGNTRAASSFYLPLPRVVRALELLQEGEPVSRGTLQTVFEYTPFDELGRLGLTTETEATARRTDPDGTGLLVVSEVVPGGPAAGALQPGDVLLRIGDTWVSKFVPLEEILDARVGETLAVQVERGGEAVTVQIEVGDLHAITPDDFLEVGRAVLNDLSYQQARNHHRPVRGVYVAVSGYMLSTAEVPAGTVITHVDGVEVPDLDAMQAELEQKAHGQRIRLRFNAVSEPRHSYETVAVVDRLWNTMQRCRRDDTTGLWPCVESPPPPAAAQVPPAAEALRVEGVDKPSRALANAFVLVDFDIPHPTSGVKDLNYVGVGTVVDAERGLVLVDRDTVPVALGDMMITVAGAVRVPGHLVYLHPHHNFAVIGYDPKLLGDVPVQSVEFGEGRLEEGDPAWLVGVDGDLRLVSVGARVQSRRALRLGFGQTPRFRDSNVDGIELSDADDTLGGVITDKKGRVFALWASFLDQREGERAFYGLPAEFIRPVLDPILRGEEPTYRALGAEFNPLSLAKARDRGLSDARIRQMIAHDPDGRHVLEVYRRWGGTPAHELLRDTDLLLAVDGRPLTRMWELEALYERASVQVTVLRDADELTFELPTTLLDGSGVDRVVSWAGIIMHAPHHEVSAQQGIKGDGVYIAWLWYGSPAARYELRPTRHIVQVDGTPTPDLDTLLQVVAGRRDGEPVRLTLAKLDGSTTVQTLKLDLHYWPTQVFERDATEWTRRGYDAAAEGGSP